MSQSQHSRQLY